ncbi:hypothetical protein [Streptomyces roseochromogenus]|uniref:Uncharacterized protein n=1 Tax=Streptomyces roseochromogenus subsp. oscitans DS 12.976 TaxID=1352936 RepID=V6JZN6_STRRC|nr:hypothetical protein [Streptomyces roseochromogenus]EST24606.1 hypothetical protein M878_30235 [Streptomyces roseochromogenus subsp. oscitans DS 12.976]
MEPHTPPLQPRQPEGCLTVAIRVPLRIVVLVLVVPVRMVWDALVVTGRLVRDGVLRPLGRALLWVGKALFVWPFVGLWRYVLVPVGKGVAWLGTVLVVVPAVWCHRYVLTPVGCAVAWLARYLLVVPARWLYDRFLAPVGRAVAWCVRGLGRPLGMIATGIGAALYWTLRVLLVLPALALWRWVLAPVGRVLVVVAREVGDALGHAWRIAGRISRAVGRALGALFRWIFVEPLRWVFRTVLTPVGHLVRDTVLRPVAEGARVLGRAVREALTSARDMVRQARADVRRMLVGEPGQPAAVDRREPQGPAARTLGSSTTALTKD